MQLPDDLRGKTVLDIGAWDGFFSFEAERRGAARVVAVEWYAWRDGGRAGFDLAQEALGSSVEAMQRPLEELDPDEIGTFDVVLFLGVLYHLPDPFVALIRCALLTRELLIVETLVDLLSVRRPALMFYEDTLKGRVDPSNWFAPNIAGCEAMLRACEFSTTKVVTRPRSLAKRLVAALRARDLGSRDRDRAVFHATK